LWWTFHLLFCIIAINIHYHISIPLSFHQKHNFRIELLNEFINVKFYQFYCFLDLTLFCLFFSQIITSYIYAKIKCWRKKTSNTGFITPYKCSSVILFRLFQMTSTHISDFRIVSTLDDPISSSYFSVREMDFFNQSK